MSVEQTTVLSNFYEKYGLKLDQFVDNQIDCKVTTEAPKLAAIRNRLFINSNEGREPYERMYQRTSFSYKWSEDKVRPQVLVQNVFDISDLVIFAKMVNQPGTLFL